MRAFVRFVAFVAAGTAVGCPSTQNVQCLEASSCDLAPGGACVAAPTGNQWCAYPDSACPSGQRYSDFDVGDGLAGACVGAVEADAGEVDSGIDAPSGTWSMPMKLPLSTTNENEENPSVSADGLELYFSGLGASKLGGNDIVFVTRATTSDDWGVTRGFLRPANTNVTEEYGANLDASGLEFFFERDGTLYSIVRASVTSQTWSSALTLGFDGRFPNISADGLTLYYFDPAASCPAGTCRSKRMRADRTSSWSGPVVEHISPTQFNHAFVSGDGLRVLLSGGSSGIATASRANTSASWGPTRPIIELPGNFHNYARWNWTEDEMYLTGAGVAPGTYDVYLSKLEP